MGVCSSTSTGPSRRFHHPRYTPQLFLADVRAGRLQLAPPMASRSDFDRLVSARLSVSCTVDGGAPHVALLLQQAQDPSLQRAIDDVHQSIARGSSVSRQTDIAHMNTMYPVLHDAHGNPACSRFHSAQDLSGLLTTHYQYIVDAAAADSRHSATREWLQLLTAHPEIDLPHHLLAVMQHEISPLLPDRQSCKEQLDAFLRSRRDRVHKEIAPYLARQRGPDKDVPLSLALLTDKGLMVPLPLPPPNVRYSFHTAQARAERKLTTSVLNLV